MGDFGNTLRQLRTAFGLKQEELARKLGISRSRIGMYETGQREPDFKTLEMIADFFNVDMNYLIAQEMFEDPDMRSLFSMKRNMDPKQFKNYMDFMKAQYKLEHPED